ncbi:MAG TPA: alpha/beta hydrolase [Rhizomicrobium sp.]|nr:alpha/beta hydrolase [Rhizomicrobium sp.]
MPRKYLVIIVVAVVAVAGAIFGFVQIDKSNFGIPRFYVWRSLGGEYHGSRRVAVNGITLYTETYGSGPPVLLVHGAGGFLETMHCFITALAPTHTVIAVDSRGQGRSTDGPGPITYSGMSDDMVALMDALHIRQADVVGWSDGGIIGLDMAMRHPGRVRRLIAVGANYDTTGIDPKEFTPAAYDEQAREIKPFYDSIAPDPKHFPIMVRKIKTLVTTEPHYTLAELGTIRAQVLIVAGERDMILRQHTDALAHAIPGAQEIIVPGATHFGPLESPAAYEAIAVKFLQ